MPSKSYSNRHELHDNRHELHSNRHELHDNRHKLHDDRHELHDNCHKLHDNRHKLHDNRHKLHDNRPRQASVCTQPFDRTLGGPFAELFSIRLSAPRTLCVSIFSFISTSLVYRGIISRKRGFVNSFGEK